MVLFKMGDSKGSRVPHEKGGGGRVAVWEAIEGVGGIVACVPLSCIYSVLEKKCWNPCECEYIICLNLLLKKSEP